jgi:hypothetical protein
MNKLLFLLVILLFYPFFGKASENIEGKIIFNNGIETQADSIVIEKDSIVFRSENTGKIFTYNINKIEKLKVIDGNHSVTGIFVGLLVSGALIYNEVYVFGEDSGVIFTTIAFSAVGYVVGKAFKNYSSVYFDENNRFSFLNEVNIMPEVNQLNFTLINYSVRF